MSFVVTIHSVIILEDLQFFQPMHSINDGIIKISE